MKAKRCKSFRGWLKNMSLFRKMLLFYIMILCIPALVINSFYIGNVSKAINEQYGKGKDNALRQAGKSIEDAVGQVEYCRNAFQYNSAVIEYVNSYDFTTGEGVRIWLQYVRPAFQQISTANKWMSEIRIWRVKEKEQNDPRYVRNASDNQELEEEAPVRYNDKKMVLDRKYQSTECRIYQPLFDINGFHKIGYVETGCNFNSLFSTLNFVKKNEVLQLVCGKECYEVKVRDDGKVYLERKRDDRRIQGFYKSTAEIKALNIRLIYFYPELSIWNDHTVTMILCGTVVLLLLFTVIYYAIYQSIAKRIVDFSGHMTDSEEERLIPFSGDDSKDEIGTMIRNYNRMAERINALNEEIVQKVKLADHARYYAMQSQIQPHFLYNTLENIDMLIELGENERASRMMNLFSRILRYNLSYEKKLTTVGSEIKHVEDYLKLYSSRMRDDFAYTVEMEPACERICCPYCMLQPVVENCFKHGFRNQERGLWIKIRAWCENGAVRITVEDNGNGISGERLEEISDLLNGERKPEREKKTEASTTVGLNNVNERIRLLCGSDSGLQILQKEQGCLVEITVSMYGRGSEPYGAAYFGRR